MCMLIYRCKLLVLNRAVDFLWASVECSLIQLTENSEFELKLSGTYCSGTIVELTHTKAIKFMALLHCLREWECIFLDFCIHLIVEL